MNTPYLGVVLFRRTSIAVLQGPFDEDLFAVEDWDLLIRVAAAGSVFANVPEVTGYYRIHDLNTSSPFSPTVTRRNEAMIRARLKVMRSDFFDALADPIRYQFFHSLLLDHLAERHIEQDQVIVSRQFLNLPKQIRAKLLYYLGVSNVVQGNNRKGREQLRMAVVTAPLSIKHDLMYCLALFSSDIVKTLISLYHWFHRQDQQPPATIPFQPKVE